MANRERIPEKFRRKEISKKVYLRAAFLRMTRFVENENKGNISYDWSTSRWRVLQRYCNALNIAIPFRRHLKTFALAEYFREGSPIYSGEKCLLSVNPNKKKSKKKRDKDRKQEYEDYLNSSKWKTFKLTLILTRGRKCEMCGAPSKFLDGHHLTYKRFMNELPEDVMLLCRDCHNEIHNKKNHSKSAKTIY